MTALHSVRTGMVPLPGTTYGPCLGGCEHLDCAALRRFAEADCVICLQPIGFERRYYEHRLGLAHATCVETEYEGDC
jgi:hypothetical protein